MKQLFLALGADAVAARVRGAEIRSVPRRKQEVGLRACLAAFRRLRSRCKVELNASVWDNKTSQEGEK
jgi:hypothetical protein